MSVYSSELGLPRPLSRKRLCPSPGTKSRLRVRGRGVPIRTIGEKAQHCSMSTLRCTTSHQHASLPFEYTYFEQKIASTEAEENWP